MIRSITTGLAMVFGMAIVAPVAPAQDVDVDAGPARIRVDDQNDAGEQAQERQEERAERRARRQQNGAAVRTNRQAGRTVRISELMGLNVTNNADEGLGEIEDIVIDQNSGRIRYVAVSMGGFLGMGDQLFAVPYEAIQIRQTDEDEYTAILNVTKQSMENAKGFDEDNWPNMADQTWQEQNDRYYQFERRGLRGDRPGRRGGVDVDANEG